MAIPSFGGGLTNSGSMPISASGGMAGPSSVNASNEFGGIKNGSIYFGGSGVPWWVWLILIVGAVLWLINR